MRAQNLVAAIISGHFTFADEQLPLPELASDSFERRERAEEIVTAWAESNRSEAIEILLPVYLKSEDPELRRRLLPALEQAYFPPKGYVGIIMSPPLNRLGNLPQLDRDELIEGVVVTQVGPGTPAEKAGLMEGDVILKINHWKVEGYGQITSLVAEQIQKHPPKTPVSLWVKRGEEMKKITLKLGILPVPSERARLMRNSDGPGGGVVNQEILEELENFRKWILSEIEKDRKNLIADRRL